MIAAIVRFEYDKAFDEARLREIAESARGKFENMPGLWSKTFGIDPERRQAVNVYVWESMDAARAFFSPQFLERVAGLYGVAPTVQFLDVAALVDNARD